MKTSFLFKMSYYICMCVCIYIYIYTPKYIQNICILSKSFKNLISTC